MQSELWMLIIGSLRPQQNMGLSLSLDILIDEFCCTHTLVPRSHPYFRQLCEEGKHNLKIIVKSWSALLFASRKQQAFVCPVLYLEHSPFNMEVELPLNEAYEACCLFF